MTLSPKIARALNQVKGSVVHFLMWSARSPPKAIKERSVRRKRRALAMLLAEQILNVIL
jgi:hypothetical protein